MSAAISRELIEAALASVETRIQQQITDARQRSERDREQRARLTAPRTAGLARRHAQKLRNLAASDFRGSQETPNSPQENAPMPPALRVACCPACRCERPARLVTAVIVSGAPHDVVKCPHPPCELMWLVRAERPRIAPVAA
ncbi:hypothetical protein [Streptomyces sp. NPDC088350]|uniref:hypothetical protein n=1 Tax=Streptomyces sp. NPDC088350 TaxID=3365854 RepID=UPI00382008DE